MSHWEIDESLRNWWEIIWVIVFFFDESLMSHLRNLSNWWVIWVIFFLDESLMSHCFFFLMSHLRHWWVIWVIDESFESFFSFFFFFFYCFLSFCQKCHRWIWDLFDTATEAPGSVDSENAIKITFFSRPFASLGVDPGVDKTFFSITVKFFFQYMVGCTDHGLTNKKKNLTVPQKKIDFKEGGQMETRGADICNSCSIDTRMYS